jgi:DNA excision repair protein ERCC-3
MDFNPNRPLVVQHDCTVLLEAHHPDFEQVRALLMRFADLVKSPDNLHTYRITPLSLWNAASSCISLEEMISLLERQSKFGLPASVRSYMRKYVKRYGLLRLMKMGNELQLVSEDTIVLKELAGYPTLRTHFRELRGDRAIAISPASRGALKQELIKLGFPIHDAAGYHQGEYLQVAMREHCKGDKPFELRDYQKDAVDAFYRTGSQDGGSGVVVLPCGAGKTIVGIAAMARLHCATLILTTNVTSVRQWKREVLEKTELTEDQVGEYNGTCKEVRPVTIATYQILTHRKSKEAEFSHVRLFNERDWGLIIYDEVHLLPAPVFRVTADIQATRRLGLTATLVREDGRAEDVFSLVGPKRYEMAWKELEGKGWIATVECKEIRVPLSDDLREVYSVAEPKHQFRISGENITKLAVIDHLLALHPNEPTLIIGQYLDQLQLISKHTGAPLISGEMGHDEREILYASFKAGTVSLLIVSKVANFAVDLPDATLAIQVSGSFGSRQEEAQRLGRILRPKEGSNRARFYSIISRDTKEQDFALKRQLFLVEQGYHYGILDWDELEAERMKQANEIQAGV